MAPSSKRNEAARAKNLRFPKTRYSAELRAVMELVFSLRWHCSSFEDAIQSVQ
jgi:hypothetical protein